MGAQQRTGARPYSCLRGASSLGAVGSCNKVHGSTVDERESSCAIGYRWILSSPFLLACVTIALCSPCQSRHHYFEALYSPLSMARDIATHRTILSRSERTFPVLAMQCGARTYEGPVTVLFITLYSDFANGSRSTTMSSETRRRTL